MILIVGVVVQMGLKFLGRMLIARMFGKVDYGVISLGLAAMTLVTPFVLIGLNMGIGRFLPRYEDAERRRGIIYTAFSISLPLAVFIGAVGAFFSKSLAILIFNDPTIAPVLQIFALTLPFAALMKLCLGVIQGFQQAQGKAYVQNLTLPLTQFGLIILALFLGWKIKSIAYAYLGSYIAASIVALLYIYTRTSAFEVGPFKPYTRELLSFSAPLMIMSVMGFIFTQVDTLMVGALRNPSEVGIYSAVFPLTALLTAFLTAFRFIVQPVLSELDANRDYGQMNELYQIVTKWVFIAAFPIFLFLTFYSSTAISLTFGTEYVSGGLALTILSVGFFTHAICGPNGTTLTALGKTKSIMYINCMVAVVNIILNYVLISKYGFVGAAVATAVAYLLMNVFYSYQLYRLREILPFESGIVRFGSIALVSHVVYYFTVFKFIEQTTVSSIVVLFTYGLFYIGLIFALGMVGKQELDMLRSLEERRKINLQPVRHLLRQIQNVR